MDTELLQDFVFELYNLIINELTEGKEIDKIRLQELINTAKNNLMDSKGYLFRKTLNNSLLVLAMIVNITTQYVSDNYTKSDEEIVTKLLENINVSIADIINNEKIKTKLFESLNINSQDEYNVYLSNIVNQLVTDFKQRKEIEETERNLERMNIDEQEEQPVQPVQPAEQPEQPEQPEQAEQVIEEEQQDEQMEVDEQIIEQPIRAEVIRAEVNGDVYEIEPPKILGFGNDYVVYDLLQVSFSILNLLGNKELFEDVKERSNGLKSIDNALSKIEKQLEELKTIESTNKKVNGVLLTNIELLDSLNETLATAEVELQKLKQISNKTSAIFDNIKLLEETIQKLKTTDIFKITQRIEKSESLIRLKDWFNDIRVLFIVEDIVDDEKLTQKMSVKDFLNKMDEWLLLKNEQFKTISDITIGQERCTIVKVVQDAQEIQNIPLFSLERHVIILQASDASLTVYEYNYKPTENGLGSYGQYKLLGQLDDMTNIKEDITKFTETYSRNKEILNTIINNEYKIYLQNSASSKFQTLVDFVYNKNTYANIYNFNKIMTLVQPLVLNSDVDINKLDMILLLKPHCISTDTAIIYKYVGKNVGTIGSYKQYILLDKIELPEKEKIIFGNIYNRLAELKSIEYKDFQKIFALIQKIKQMDDNKRRKFFDNKKLIKIIKPLEKKITPPKNIPGLESFETFKLNIEKERKLEEERYNEITYVDQYSNFALYILMISYLLDQSMPINDPNLIVLFSMFKEVSTSFGQKFVDLPCIDRIRFIEYLLNFYKYNDVISQDFKFTVDIENLLNKFIEYERTEYGLDYYFNPETKDINLKDILYKMIASDYKRMRRKVSQSNNKEENVKVMKNYIIKTLQLYYGCNKYKHNEISKANEEATELYNRIYTEQLNKYRENQAEIIEQRAIENTNVILKNEKTRLRSEKLKQYKDEGLTKEQIKERHGELIKEIDNLLTEKRQQVLDEQRLVEQNKYIDGELKRESQLIAKKARKEYIDNRVYDINEQCERNNIIFLYGTSQITKQTACQKYKSLLELRKRKLETEEYTRVWNIEINKPDPSLSREENVNRAKNIATQAKKDLDFTAINADVKEKCDFFEKEAEQLYKINDRLLTEIISNLEQEPIIYQLIGLHQCNPNEVIRKYLPNNPLEPLIKKVSEMKIELTRDNTGKQPLLESKLAKTNKNSLIFVRDKNIQRELTSLKEFVSNETNRLQITSALGELSKNYAYGETQNNPERKQELINKIRNLYHESDLANFLITFLKYYGTLTEIPKFNKITARVGLNTVNFGKLAFTHVYDLPESIQADTYYNLEQLMIKNDFENTNDDDEVRSIVQLLLTELGKKHPNITEIQTLVNFLKVKIPELVVNDYSIEKLQKQFKLIDTYLVNQKILNTSRSIKFKSDPMHSSLIMRENRRRRKQGLNKVITPENGISIMKQQLILKYKLSEWLKGSSIRYISMINKNDSPNNNPFFGPKIYDNKILKLYAPSITFWSMYVDLTLEERINMFTSPNRQYSIGIIENLAGITQIKEFTDQDFKKEHEYFTDITSIYDIRKLDGMVLSQLSKNIGEEKYNNIRKYFKRILDESINELLKANGNNIDKCHITFIQSFLNNFDKTINTSTIDDHVHTLSLFLSLINQDSPIFEVSKTFQKLFCTLSIDTIGSINFNLRNLVPEIVLIPTNSRRLLLDNHAKYIENMKIFLKQQITGIIDNSLRNISIKPILIEKDSTFRFVNNEVDDINLILNPIYFIANRVTDDNKTIPSLTRISVNDLKRILTNFKTEGNREIALNDNIFMDLDINEKERILNDLERNYRVYLDDNERLQDVINMTINTIVNDNFKTILEIDSVNNSETAKLRNIITQFAKNYSMEDRQVLEKMRENSNIIFTNKVTTLLKDFIEKYPLFVSYYIKLYRDLLLERTPRTEQEKNEAFLRLIKTPISELTNQMIANNNINLEDYINDYADNSKPIKYSEKYKKDLETPDILTYISNIMKVDPEIINSRITIIKNKLDSMIIEGKIPLPDKNKLYGLQCDYTKCNKQHNFDPNNPRLFDPLSPDSVSSYFLDGETIVRKVFCCIDCYNNYIRENQPQEFTGNANRIINNDKILEIFDNVLLELVKSFVTKQIDLDLEDVSQHMKYYNLMYTDSKNDKRLHVRSFQSLKTFLSTYKSISEKFISEENTNKIIEEIMNERYLQYKESLLKDLIDKDEYKKSPNKNIFLNTLYFRARDLFRTSELLKFVIVANIGLFNNSLDRIVIENNATLVRTFVSETCYIDNNTLTSMIYNQISKIPSIRFSEDIVKYIISNNPKCSLNSTDLDAIKLINYIGDLFEIDIDIFDILRSESELYVCNLITKYFRNIVTKQVLRKNPSFVKTELENEVSRVMKEQQPEVKLVSKIVDIIDSYCVNDEDRISMKEATDVAKFYYFCKLITTSIRNTILDIKKAGKNFAGAKQLLGLDIDNESYFKLMNQEQHIKINYKLTTAISKLILERTDNPLLIYMSRNEDKIALLKNIADIFSEQYYIHCKNSTILLEGDKPLPMNVDNVKTTSIWKRRCGENKEEFKARLQRLKDRLKAAEQPAEQPRQRLGMMRVPVNRANQQIASGDQNDTNYIDIRLNRINEARKIMYFNGMKQVAKYFKILGLNFYSFYLNDDNKTKITNFDSFEYKNNEVRDIDIQEETLELVSDIQAQNTAVDKPETENLEETDLGRMRNEMQQYFRQNDVAEMDNDQQQFVYDNEFMPIDNQQHFVYDNEFMPMDNQQQFVYDNEFMPMDNEDTGEQI